MSNIVVVLSGGLDSVTMLHSLIKDNNVYCLSFNYNQKHSVELDYAKYWTEKLDVPHQVINLDSVFSNSALTGDKEMPLTDYSVESMKSTVVPNRNMVMLSIAISKAIAIGFDSVAYGAHSSDYNVYPDCRPEFIDAMQSAASLCDWKDIKIITPLVDLDKTGVVRLARELGVDISRTWSCYQGGDTPCGVCGSCRSRIEAINES